MRISLAVIGLLTAVGSYATEHQADRVFLHTGAVAKTAPAAWITQQWPVEIAARQLTTNTDKLNLTLSGGVRLVAQKLSARLLEDGTLTWHGLLGEAGKEPAAAGTLNNALHRIILVSTNGRITGTLRWQHRTYRLHYLSKSDSYMLDEVNDAGLPSEDEHGQENAVIRVLVVATKTASESGEDLQGLVRLGIAESNSTFENSEIKLSLELAGVMEVDYTSIGGWQIDLIRLQDKSDGYMDEVPPERDRLKADVVVLLDDAHPDFCGRARATPADEDTAFVAVNLRCIGVSRYIMAHEIAHLAGSAHEYRPKSGYEYGHGYHIKSGGTVMTSIGDAPVRLPFWSDPKRFMEWERMGDPATADNRRLLEERKWVMAGFR